MAHGVVCHTGSHTDTTDANQTQVHISNCMFPHACTVPTPAKHRHCLHDTWSHTAKCRMTILASNDCSHS